MMTLLQVFALSGLVNFFIVLGLGIFIILHNWRDKLNRLYFLIVLAVCIWSFGYWKWLSSVDVASALFWVRILSIGSILIPVFYFHWIVRLLKIEKQQKNVIRMVYALAFIFSLSSFSNLFVAGVEFKLFFPFWPNPGVIYHFYLLVLYICLVVYSANLLIKNYRKSQGEDKKRLEYVLAGALLAFVGGLSNFFLWYDIPIAPYGNFVVAFYPFLFGYATIRYRLFNVKTITTELFAIAIWIFLFIKILISVSTSDLIINIILFLNVVFFGLLLIKSILNEVRQKEQIEKMAKDVQKAYEVEKRAHRELEELDNVKNQFLMTIQHHLRTPLTAMRGYSDLLLGGTYGKLPKKVKEVVVKFESSTTDLINMVNKFLDITQFQLGKEVVSVKEDVDLLQTFEQIVGDLELEARNKNIYLKLEKPSEDFVIKADEAKLKAALANVVDNAIKYTAQGGVTVKMRKCDVGEAVRIEITDTGMGIAQEKLPTLFSTTFERSESSKKQFALGRGIGLFLSNKIINAHQGKIWAESEGIGKGSVFFIELPYVQKLASKVLRTAVEKVS